PTPEIASLASTIRAGEKPKAVQRLGVPDGMPAGRLDKTGWVVLWASDVVAEVKQALAPLLELRRAEAGTRFRELDWTPELSVRAWLTGQYAGNTVDPQKVPYYVLVVGSPATIPFEWEYALASAGYAVGRLDFGSEDQAFARY